MKENKTSNGAVLRIAFAGFSLGYLVEYNKTNGFEWPFLIAYGIVLAIGIASYMFLRKGYK
jgi:hypothetical protein